MKIEDLYLELGRAMTEKITVGQESRTKQDVLQEQVHTLNRELQSERDKLKTRQERIQIHVDELQEAIRLVAEGLDPTLAKLTAKESLEERRAVERVATKITGGGGGGGGGAGAGGNYTINNPYGMYAPNTLPVTVAAGVAAGAAGPWHSYTIPTYGSSGYNGTPTP